MHLDKNIKWPIHWLSAGTGDKTWEEKPYSLILSTYFSNLSWLKTAWGEILRHVPLLDQIYQKVYEWSGKKWDFPNFHFRKGEENHPPEQTITTHYWIIRTNIQFIDSKVLFKW